MKTLDEIERMNYEESVNLYKEGREDLINRSKQIISELYTTNADGSINFKEGVTKEKMLMALQTMKKIARIIEENDDTMKDLAKEKQKADEHATQTRNKILAFEEEMGFEMPLPTWIKEMYKV